MRSGAKRVDESKKFDIFVKWLRAFRANESTGKNLSQQKRLKETIIEQLGFVPGGTDPQS